MQTRRRARRIIEDWSVDYNLNRPHTSLDGLTPHEFATRSAMDQNVYRANLQSATKRGAVQGANGTAMRCAAKIAQHAKIPVFHSYKTRLLSLAGAVKVAPIFNGNASGIGGTYRSARYPRKYAIRVSVKPASVSFWQIADLNREALNDRLAT